MTVLSGRLRAGQSVWHGLAALTTALWADLLFSIGWTFAACEPVAGTNYGLGYAGYGLPLPYMQWGQVSSVQFNWIPSVLVFNLFVLSIVGLVLLWPFRGVLHQGWRRWTIGALLLVGALLQLFRINAFLTLPIDRLHAREVEISLSDMRPVAVYFGRGSYECTPSPFWFPQHQR